MDDRRETGRRLEVIRSVVSHIVQNPHSMVTLKGVQHSLGVPPDAAHRIVERLVSAGIVEEVERGVWVRVPE
jgi:predicted transcriptional regulator of viral defense system